VVLRRRRLLRRPRREREHYQPGYRLFGAETVPFNEAQPSPDGAYWRCRRNDGSRRCFFAPPQSY